jgi:hypothetical protein
VLIDGPASDAAALVQRALALLGSAAPAPAALPARIGAHAA